VEYFFSDFEKKWMLEVMKEGSHYKRFVFDWRGDV